jgi:hypothetical protein
MGLPGGFAQAFVPVASGGGVPVVNTPPAIVASTNNAGTSQSGGAITYTPLTATNSPTSWAITTQPCTNCLAIDSSGNVTGGSGAASLTGSFAGTTYNFAVTATNGSGTSSVKSLSFTMYNDGALSASVGGTIVKSDLLGAKFTVTVTGGTNFTATNIGPWARTIVPGDEFFVNGTDQSVTIATYSGGSGTLSGSVTNVSAQPASTVYPISPPWKVAGVDYPVGIPSSTTLTPFTSSSVVAANCSVNTSTGFVNCSGNNLVFNGIDFSTSGGAQLYCDGCNNITVENCKFSGQIPLTNDGVALIQIGSGLVIDNDISESVTVPGGNYEIGALIAATGAITVEGNYFHNYENQVVNFTAAGTTTTLYRFNYIDTDYTCNGCHQNYQQLGDGGSTTTMVPEVYGNTTFQGGFQNGGEGFQFYEASNQTIVINSAIMCNNTMIAASFPGGTMATMVHGSTDSPGTSTTGSPNACNNYIDPIGNFEFFGSYASIFGTGQFNSPWADSPPNWNMRTNATIPWPP